MSSEQVAQRSPPPIVKSTSHDERKSPRFLGSPPFSKFFRRRSSGSENIVPHQSLVATPSNSSPPLTSSSSPNASTQKFFPRSTTLPSIAYSDSSTFTPSSPPLVLRHLDEKELPESLSKISTPDEPATGPMRSIQITGITVFLSNTSKAPLSVKLIVKGKEHASLPFKPADDVNTPLRWNLQPAFTMHSSSNLVIQIRKRRRWPKNPVLVEIPLPYEQVSEVIPAEQDDTTTYNLKIHDEPLIMVDLIADADPLHTNLRAAADRAREVKSALDALGKSRHFLEQLLAYGVALSEIDPIAKAILSTVKVVYKQLQRYHEYDRKVFQLVESMARTLGYIEDVEQFARLAQLKKALEDVRPLMEDTTNFVLKFIHMSRTEKTFQNTQYRDEIDSLDKRFEKFQQQFDRGLSVQAGGTIEAILDRLISTDDERLLQELKPKGLETGAYAFSECMKGTRLDVLSAIDEWVNDLDAPNILWIRGFPGVGKTAIASTVVNRLRELNRLGARFVFQRDQETLSTPNALWRSVAYDFARQYPTIRQVIVEHMREDDLDVETSNVKGLFRELVEEPLQKSDDIPEGRLPVSVIDALDECGGRDGRQSQHRAGLLQTIKRWSKLPSKFKLIVTSRIEDDITRVLAPCSEALDLSSGNTVKERASNDIRLFLTHKFRKISKQYQSLNESEWPSEEAIDTLTDRAAGLFLWAKTAVEFVNLGEPTDQLRQIIEGTGLGDVAQLYRRALEISFRSPSTEVVQAFQDIVGAMIFAKRPLTTEDCTRLLPYSPSMLEFIRKGLRSVLDEGDVLRFSHQSFVEFLLDPEACPTPFHIEALPQHHNLSIVCLSAMRDDLRFNICNFPTSHKRNAAIPDLDVSAQRYITSPLTYASRFWMDHVNAGPFDEDILALVKPLIHEKLLYWFEVLSIIGEMFTASPMLQDLLEWIKPSEDQELIDFIEDAIKFLGAFAGVMAQSAPHIYISALPFAPENSLVAGHYLPQYPGTMRVVRGRFSNWPRIVFTVDEHDDVVTSAVFSPDAKLIVSASHDKTVRVWDAQTGDMTTGPLEGHQSSVASAAICLERKLIASGSDDCTIRLWDADSGEEVGKPLEHHSSVISTVLFSPDGDLLASASYDGNVILWKLDQIEDGPILVIQHAAAVTTIAFSPDGARLASGSIDRMVRVWDTASGDLLNGPYEGHTNSINCVVFSPDETTIASASEDETIRLWDILTNEPINEPLEGHTDAVTSISFSPDGRRLVSGAHDGILLLWDPQTANVICEFTGHRNGVTSVAFSPDGKRILSGSADETIAVWDATCENDEFQLTPILHNSAHQDNVKSVNFSPNGKFLASGSDDETLRVWDADTGVQVEVGFHREDIASHHWYRFPSPPTHKQGVEVVVYSPHGLFIATGGGQNDEVVCVWNSETGALHTPPLRGHTGGITSIVWFPDSCRLASSSYDDTVRVWDVNSGEVVAGPFQPHDSWVTSLAISKDGALLASGSRDHSIRIMDAASLEPIGEPLVGHDRAVNCVVFTPDCRFLASGSNDRSIRLWEIETGNWIWRREDAHNGFILSLAITEDGRCLASSSTDKTINIWDIETGTLHLGPLEGHTGAVFSVTFNPDGTRLASSAEDETIRVWDVSSTQIESDFADARPLHTAEFADDSGYQNGWIVRSRKDSADCLLLWVPPWSRSGVWWPRNTAVITEVPVKLDLSNFKHGSNWYLCREMSTEWD